MINKCNNEKLLGAILSAQVSRNLNNTALIQKANSMPHCKKNIMLALLLFWDKVFTDITDILLHHEKASKRVWNVNQQCLDYVLAQKLANPFFAEFFFAYHSALTDAFLEKLTYQLNNGMAYAKKFSYLTGELSELLNLAQISLSGLRISCETFGGEAVCIDAKNQKSSDCGKVDNIVCAMISDEHMLHPELLAQTLEATIPYLKQAKHKMIMILDYRNLEQASYTFGKMSRKRHDAATKIFEAVYLYHCDLGMTFGPEFKGLEPYVIPNKAGLKKVIDSWRNKQEVITFA